MRDAPARGTTIDELLRLGAVGYAFGTVIDADGEPVDLAMNERVIGAGSAGLARISNVTIALGGWHKDTKARALLGLDLVDTLVADDAMARQLLA